MGHTHCCVKCKNLLQQPEKLQAKHKPGTAAVLPLKASPQLALKATSRESSCGCPGLSSCSLTKAGLKHPFPFRTGHLVTRFSCCIWCALCILAFGTVWITPYFMGNISVLLPPEFLSMLFKRHL